MADTLQTNGSLSVMEVEFSGPPLAVFDPL
jgi:hypothetical protein